MRQLHAVSLEFEACLTRPEHALSRLRTARDEFRLGRLLDDERVLRVGVRLLVWWMHQVRTLGPGDLPQLPTEGRLGQADAVELVDRIHTVTGMPLALNRQMQAAQELLHAVPPPVAREALVAGAQVFLWTLDWARLTMRDYATLSVLIDAAGEDSPPLVVDAVLANTLLAHAPASHRHGYLAQMWRNFYERCDQAGGDPVAEQITGGLSTARALGQCVAILVSLLAHLGRNGLPGDLITLDLDGDVPDGAMRIEEVDPTPPSREELREAGKHRPLWAAGLAWRMVTAFQQQDEAEQGRMLELIGDRREVGSILVSVMSRWLRDAAQDAKVDLPVF